MAALQKYPRVAMLLSQRAANWTSCSCLATLRPMASSDYNMRSLEYFEKQRQLKRPLSPHLTIYRPQVTSMLSITHRGTGVFNWAVLTSFAVGAVAMPGNMGMCIDAIQAMHYGPALIFAAKYCLAWPLAYHALNGCRHLAWDMGHGFQISDLYKSGYLVLGLSFVLAAALASL